MAFRLRLDPLKRGYVYRMYLSFALANGKQTVTGVWPAKAGDFNSLANYFRAKWADYILFNHGKQTRVLFIFAEAIYRSFVDQFFQLRRREPLELRSCQHEVRLEVCRLGIRLLQQTFRVRLRIF